MPDPRLYVNDTPERIEGHAHIYPADRVQVVQVTFVTADGWACRASFDPQTGEGTLWRYRDDDAIPQGQGGEPDA